MPKINGIFLNIKDTKHSMLKVFFGHCFWGSKIRNYFKMFDFLNI